MSPTVELDMAGRFVPNVDPTRGDEDGNYHFSDIPLLLTARANAAPKNSAFVTFSQAEGDLMRHVPSLQPTPSPTDVNP